MSDTPTSRPIRVLHICTIMLTAQTFIAPLARYLRARGYEVSLACSAEDAADGPGLSATREVAGCPLYPVAIPRTIRPLADLRAVWQLYRLIRSPRPEIGWGGEELDSRDVIARGSRLRLMWATSGFGVRNCRWSSCRCQGRN